MGSFDSHITQGLLKGIDLGATWNAADPATLLFVNVVFNMSYDTRNMGSNSVNMRYADRQFSLKAVLPSVFDTQLVISGSVVPTSGRQWSVTWNRFAIGIGGSPGADLFLGTVACSVSSTTDSIGSFGVTLTKPIAMTGWLTWNAPTPAQRIFASLGFNYSAQTNRIAMNYYPDSTFKLVVNLPTLAGFEAQTQGDMYLVNGHRWTLRIRHLGVGLPGGPHVTDTLFNANISLAVSPSDSAGKFLVTVGKPIKLGSWVAWNSVQLPGSSLATFRMLSVGVNYTTQSNAMYLTYRDAGDYSMVAGLESLDVYASSTGRFDSATPLVWNLTVDRFIAGFGKTYNPNVAGTGVVRVRFPGDGSIGSVYVHAESPSVLPVGTAGSYSTTQVHNTSVVLLNIYYRV